MADSIVKPIPFTGNENAQVRQGRRADDGRWYSQTVPFPIDVYSAFFDNRSSLMSTTPQVVVVAKFNKRGLFRCVLWLDSDSSPVSVSATMTTFLSGVDKIVICPLPAYIAGGRVPVEVAIAWRSSEGPGQTAYRVPVEVPQHRKTRGRLVLCLASVFGGGWQPRRVVEWLETQRLLGVERVIVYNQSMSRDAGRVFADYSVVDVNEPDAESSVPFVELRQSSAPRQIADSSYACQLATINDCMYRNVNSFRHIAVLDFDELIVPRRNYTTIPQMLEHAAAGVSGRPIGSYVFRNAHFFIDRLPNETDESDTYRLAPDSQRRNASFSLYLTRRRRSVSPFHYAIKAIVDADACVGMWMHYCRRYTRKFERSSRDAVTMIDVDVQLALKHHYRNECDFDHFPDFYSTGSCRRAMQSMPAIDDVMEKYADRLVPRLGKRYARLGI